MIAQIEYAKKIGETYRIKPCSVVIISPGVYNRGGAFPENSSGFMRLDAKRISMLVVMFF